MIQDIFPHRLRNEFIPGRALESDGLLFAFRDGGLLCHIEAGRVRVPLVKEAEALNDCRYLFALDERPCFVDMDGGASLPEDYAPVRVGGLRAQAEGPRELIFAAWTAFQLYNWYRDNRFCGTCGSRTVHSETERAVKCPSCGRTIYPRIIPAVIVGVINGDKILLTKYAGRDVPFYALIAGFTEIGETFEETVQREVMEEAGIRVKNIRYYKSQPWGIVDDLLAGFYCDVDGDPTIHMDKNELKEAGWHTRDEIVLQPTDHSLTNEMMTRFKKGLEC